MSDELARRASPGRRSEALAGDASAGERADAHAGDAAVGGDAALGAAARGGLDARRLARPALTTPRRLRGGALLARERELVRRQPWLGVAGLVVVLPVAALIAVAAGGAERSLELLAPLSTFALPVVAVIAFWWEDWPGASLTPGWSGVVDTALIVVGAVALTIAGQAVVGRVDFQSLFDATPGPGHAATFPATMAVAATAFTAVLQLTLVCEGWPLRGALPRVWAGVAAVALSWGIAVLVFFLIADVHPSATDAAAGLKQESGLVSGPGIGAWLLCLALWQAAPFVALRGWPVANIDRRGVRILAGNALTIAGAWATYLLLHDLLGVAQPLIEATLACGIAAVLLAAVLMQGWIGDKLQRWRWRALAVCAAATVAVVLYLVLRAIADVIDFQRAQATDWIVHASLDALGTAILLHVAVWRRWPVSAVR
jgi:hypothetical protein